MSEPIPGTPNSEQPSGMALARLAWVIVALTYLGVYIAAIPYGYAAFSELCRADACMPFQLTERGFEALGQLGISPRLYLALLMLAELSLLSWPLLALFIFLRRSGEWIGLLVSMVLVAVGLNGFSDSVNVLVAETPRLALLYSSLSAFGVTLLILLLFLFPDGRFVPGWSRYLAFPLAVASLADPLLATVVPPITDSAGTLAQVAVLVIGVPAGIVAQIQRYRNDSSLEQRQQTKWVLLGFIGVLLVILTWVITTQLFPPSPGLPRVSFNLLAVPVLLVLMQILPISMTFSILRYRLFDIDIIIKRTLIYSGLTASILALYFATVLLLQYLFRIATGQANQLAVVASTLLIAGLFNPLRQRIQTAVNRRFFRAEYDAAQTLSAFGESVRDEVDLAEMQSSLLKTVQETMRPTRVSLWIRDNTKRGQTSP